MPKYNEINNIPAKVFFEILESKNYQLLKPKPSEKLLEEVFISIYDEFFLKSDNPEANEYLKVTKEIASLTYKIAVLKQSLYFYYHNTTTEKMRLDFIEALKEGYDIIINTELPFIDEVHRILTIEIGIIENDLISAKTIFNSMTSKSKSKAFDYEEQVVNIENVIGRNINDGIKLDKYIAYEKQAKKIVSQQQQNKKVA